MLSTAIRALPAQRTGPCSIVGAEKYGHEGRLGALGEDTGEEVARPSRVVTAVTAERDVSTPLIVVSETGAPLWSTVQKDVARGVSACC